MKKKIPTSSYRLQLTRHFCFERAKSVIRYLKELGVEMVYTSPYFERVTNSENPYLITSSLSIAKELGGEKGFFSFCRECKKYSILHMMDIVPNHMAASKENPWWLDVIEKGSESPYASFFDIDWEYGKGELILVGARDIHQRINYRRFFDICEMVGLNIEHLPVYEAYFSKIKEYFDLGLVQGFRVDHIDGLKNPKEFLFRLHVDFPSAYVALEKIVQDGELVRTDFLCDGTVGYEVLFLIDQVLLNGAAKQTFCKLFEKYKEDDQSLAQMKISYLQTYLASEITRFSSKFGVSKEELLLFLSHFPVYRSYVLSDKVSQQDRAYIDYAASFTKGSFFKNEIYQKEHRETLLKLQQILPAVFAKGFEDTFNYRHLTLASLNEVGGDPLQFSISSEKFHQRIFAIFQRYPNTMHTLSTHDTKRSLDARMRLHILAEMEEEFMGKLQEWMQIVPPFSSGFVMIFFFQNLLAISSENVIARMSDYMIKSMREGKLYSDHLQPNSEFEHGLKEWIFFVLNDKKFLQSFYPFKEKVAKAAEKKSLAALVLQMGLFGVMDIYQGEELENANLVDPDNRREVDFSLRKKALKDGSNEKMNLLKIGLQFRKQHKTIVHHGTYEPLELPDHFLGYRRVYKGEELVVIVNKRHYGKKSKEMPRYKNRRSIFSDELSVHLSVGKI